MYYNYLSYYYTRELPANKSFEFLEDLDDNNRKNGQHNTRKSEPVII